MSVRKTSKIHSFRCLIGLTALQAILISGTAFGAPDMDIQNEVDYQQVVDAMRAAEYMRQDYLETNTNPRAIAGMAGLWVFAERNPLATLEQLTAFGVAYDTELSESVSGDPMLLRVGSVMTALHSSSVEPAGVLIGTDTRIGNRAMTLLGIDLPGLDGYQESRQRMARYDLATVQRLIHRTETADMLTAVLAGIDPSSHRLTGLAQAGAAYLESLNYTPMLGLVDPDQIEVNEGLAGLPSYLEFVAIRDVDGAHLTLESEVFTRIDAVQADGAVILSEIGVVEAVPNLALNTFDLFTAATDPEDPNHDAALAELEDRRQDVLASVRETSDDRAAIFARTLLLQQSSYPSVESVATSARSFAGLQLQTNNDLAVAQSGIGIAGSVIGFGVSVATKDPAGAVGSIFALVASAIDLGGELGDGPPSPEEQIYGQIIELRQQVEDLRVQMNERFDIVDAKLDSIFETVVIGFGALGNQIGDLQDDVNELGANIAAARSSLDRIEAALFGFAEDVLLQDLSVQTDLALNYRDDTGLDLSYGDQTPNFVTSASLFTTYATTTAQLPSFAGPADGQPLILTLENAQEQLSAQPVARLLNDLRRVPLGLFTAGGDPIVGPITAGRVPAPAPWSQAAAAYGQFARENPWYFAYMLRTQQDAGSGNGPQIDQIIAQGQRISTLAAATRARGDLFEGLLLRAFDDLVPFQPVIDASIDAEIAARGLAFMGNQVDPWGMADQGVLLGTSVTVCERGECYDLAGYDGDNPFVFFEKRGFEIFISDDRDADSAVISRDVLADRNMLVSALNGIEPTVTASIRTYIGGQLSQFEIDWRLALPGTDIVRTLGVRMELRYPDGVWRSVPNNFNNFVGIGQVRNAFPDDIFFYYPERIESGDAGGTYEFSQRIGISFDGTTVTQTRYRMIVTSDQSRYLESDGVSTFFTQVDAIEAGLEEARTAIRERALNDLLLDGALIETVGPRLDNTAALLDGYVTLGLADVITRSELIRSALRGVPSADGLGFRTEDLLATLLAEADRDDGSFGGAPDFDLPDFGAHFSQRIAALGAEIDAARQIDAPSFPYVDFVLGELSVLRDNAYRLATADTYMAAGSISVDAAGGLMANDIGQPGRIDNQDLMVDPDFITSPDYTAPANGSVSLSADGSFSYTPDPGFEGIDSFNYRLVAEVGDPSNPVGDPNVYSAPAQVVLRVTTTACAADLNSDGSLNFLDISTFLSAFGNMDPAADFNNDGSYNFLDVSVYLNIYGAGCP